MKRVAIQGIAGSYHEIAARLYFGHEVIEIVSCDSFRKVIERLKEEKELLGLLAIENTIAGSLLQNHELIRKSGLKIIGEKKLRISHNLAALPGTEISDIQEIDSHPMAIMQCRDYLDSLPNSETIRFISKEDTAMSARWIAENRLENHAAICSRSAAKIHGLEILAEAIETDAHNYTRFLILSDPESIGEIDETKINKVSLLFSIPHTKGSLSQILSVLSYYGMNLTKIQSFPMLGLEWHYLFYVDFMFEEFTHYRKALDAIEPLTRDLQILGEYTDSERDA